MAVIFTGDFTGTNGDPIDSGSYTTNSEGSVEDYIEIQDNEAKLKCGDSTDDFCSIRVDTADITNCQVLLYVDPSNISNSDNQWLYVMLRSSGESVNANAGRPATAYYWRFHLGNTKTGTSDYLYRRISDSESSSLRTAGAWRNANEPFYVRMEVEDSGSDVIIYCSAWDADASEPGSWDETYTDTSPGALHDYAGQAQFVLRNFAGSNSPHLRIDDISIQDLDETDGHVFKIWTGSVWTEVLTQAWGGASHDDGVLKAWNGSAWV